MGPYCKFCDQRCFVERIIPADGLVYAGQTILMATCPDGMSHDKKVCGHDQTTAINPAKAESGMSIEKYAIDLLVSGAEAAAEDDTNELGAIDDTLHEGAVSLALDMVVAIRENPDHFIRWFNSSHGDGYSDGR